MKRQLQGIALILVSILLMLGYGNVAFFDLSFKWALIFSVIGMNGLILQIILAVLYQLLQFFHALLGGFHSLPD